MYQRSLVYKYDLQDHLGNTRVTFTTEVQTDVYVATMEEEDTGQLSAAATAKNLCSCGNGLQSVSSRLLNRQYRHGKEAPRLCF